MSRFVTVSEPEFSERLDAVLNRFITLFRERDRRQQAMRSARGSTPEPEPRQPRQQAADSSSSKVTEEKMQGSRKSASQTRTIKPPAKARVVRSSFDPAFVAMFERARERQQNNRRGL